MPKKFKCKTCQTEDSKEFYSNRKNICKKCIAENQRKDYEEKKALIEKAKAEELKPETPRARSSSPSRENYETFRQAVLDLKAIADKQGQDFELYKVNADFKIQALESQIQTLINQIQILESRPIIINTVPIPEPVLPEIPIIRVPTPEPSPLPSRAPSPVPIRSKSKSPVKENPIKAEYKAVIAKIEEDYELFEQNKRPKHYTREPLIELAIKYNINRHSEKKWDKVADIILAELKHRLSVC